MVRYLRYAFLGALGLLLLMVALANREPVALALLPTETAAWLGLTQTITLPLFLVIFAGIIVGLLIGFFWEWLREARQRAEAQAAKRELSRLRAEVTRLRGDTGQKKDDVLALLENAGKVR